jgi:hypothetical protein
VPGPDPAAAAQLMGGTWSEFSGRASASAWHRAKGSSNWIQQQRSSQERILASRPDLLGKLFIIGASFLSQQLTILCVFVNRWQPFL